MDWNRIAKALNLVDYKGVIVMEPFVLTTAHNAKRTRVWRDLSYALILINWSKMLCVGGDFLRRILAENQ